MEYQEEKESFCTSACFLTLASSQPQTNIWLKNVWSFLVVKFTKDTYMMDQMPCTVEPDKEIMKRKSRKKAVDTPS